MKKSLILMVIIAVVLVGSLTGYGLYLKNTNGTYYDLEKKLAEAAKVYYGQYPGYLPAKRVTIKSQKLIDENFLEELEDCSGYVVVTKSGIAYQYKSFIKCKDYMTKKYDAQEEV